mgnify:FL=1
MLNPFKKSRTAYNNSSVHKQVARLRTPRYELDDSGTNGSQPGIVVTWWTRLLSSVVSGDIPNQNEQYLAHQTSQDYLFNALGQGAWGALFPLLTVVCSQLVGIEQAGLFSMAFVVATLLLFIAQYLSLIHI